MAAQGEPGESGPAVDIQDVHVDPIEDLRGAPGEEDDDGQPLWPAQKPASNSRTGRKSAAGGSARHPRCSQPPRSTKDKPFAPRPSRGEVERRIAEAQLWIAQRLPLIRIRDNAAQNWGVTNTKTVNRYLNLARERMVEELISDRRRHQAEQIYALNECARRAMDAEQFSAAVGAFRVIAEIGGLLRAPIKPPEARG
jgi:hypothetical protein